MLNISEKKLENSMMEIKVVVPVEQVENEYVIAFNKLKNIVKLDGFRKGKAPQQLVETHFKKEADQEVAENLLKGVFLEAIKEKNLTPIAYPKYEFDRISRTEPFSFKAVFEVPPTTELGKYRGIAVEEQPCILTGEDLVSEMDAIRERLAKVTKKEDEAALVLNGDLARIKVKRIDDVDPSGRDGVEFKEYSIVVGKSTDESALDKYITGMKVGEEKEIDVKYPKNYYMEDLAGQRVTYHVVIAEVSGIELPELTDEFAKKMGYETVDEFRIKTREYLEKYATDRSMGDAKAAILKEIVQDSTFDLPESMIINQMSDLFQRTRQNVGYESDNLEEFARIMGMDTKAFLDRLRDEATQTLKTTLALSEIAKKEELKVDENRYKETVQNLASRNNKTVEEIEEILARNDSKKEIESELLLDNAMEFIYKNAKVKKLKPLSFKEFMEKRKK